MTDRETIAVYDARAQDYLDRFGSGRPGRHLRAFMEGLPPGAAVLDLGCGPGQSAAHLAAAGFDVMATDASAEMARLASTQPGVRAAQASFDDLTQEAAYDGVWANFALLHAPRADMLRHLSAIHRALRPGGLFHIGLKTGTGTARDRIGRVYTYYTRDELTGLLTEAGFGPIRYEATGCEAGLAGTEDPWLILQVVRDG